MADTGFKSPTATGEDYNDFLNPTDAYSSNDVETYAIGINDKQDYYDFTFGVPSGATIDGIEVTVEGEAPSNYEGVIEVEVSHDGGTTYTSQNKQNTFTDTESTETYGGSTDTWGRSWSQSEFSDANFRVRMEWFSGTNFMAVDHIQIKVYYTTDGGQDFTETPSDSLTFSDSLSSLS